MLQNILEFFVFFFSSEFIFSSHFAYLQRQSFKHFYVHHKHWHTHPHHHTTIHTPTHPSTHPPTHTHSFVKYQKENFIKHNSLSCLSHFGGSHFCLSLSPLLILNTQTLTQINAKKKIKKDFFYFFTFYSTFPSAKTGRCIQSNSEKCVSEQKKENIK